MIIEELLPYWIRKRRESSMERRRALISESQDLAEAELAAIAVVLDGKPRYRVKALSRPYGMAA
jgi:hypothetical protein